MARGSKSLAGNVTIRVYKATCKTKTGQRSADSLVLLLFTAREEKKKEKTSQSRTWNRLIHLGKPAVLKFKMNALNTS